MHKPDQVFTEGFPLYPLVELPGQTVNRIKLFSPVLIESATKSFDQERVFIERSSNSTRISIRIKQLDTMDSIICRQFMKSMMRRADDFEILRRAVVPTEPTQKGYSISFLVTSRHLSFFGADKIVEFLVYFVTEADKEISHMKLYLNSRGRAVASSLSSCLS